MYIFLFLVLSIFIFFPKRLLFIGGGSTTFLKAILVPHAGFKFIEEAATYAYDKIDWKNYKKIIMLSTNHINNEIMVAKTNNTDHNLILKEFDFAITDDNIFYKEHSWKNQLPFIPKDVPLMIFNVGKFIPEIKNFVDDDTLIICNTDLSHCGPNYNQKCDDPEQLDSNTISKLKQLNTYSSKEMCGKYAVETFYYILEHRKWFPSLSHKYTNSNMYHQSENRVGYVSMMYYNNLLMRIPRQVMENSNKTIQDVFDNNIDSIFVSIYKQNRLRGCIGVFDKNVSLNDMIKKSTLKSANNDPRFTRIEKNEIPLLTYKISFNYKPVKIYNGEGNIFDILEKEIIVGKHGITLEFDNGAKSTYLSSVLPKYNDFKSVVYDLVLKAKQTSISNLKNIYKYISIEYDE